MTDNQSFDSWDDEVVDLKMKLLRGIYAYGFEQPSPIQKKAVIPMTEKQDMLAQAQSGTGKTGAFTVGTLQLINEKKNEVQAIVLAPTRELAKQITDVMHSIGKEMKARITSLVGGTRIHDDIAKFRDTPEPPHVAVACPGRLIDIFKRGGIDTNQLKLLVLDEADELLSRGFKDQIYEIFQFLPQDIQVCLFSATVPPEVEEITSKFLRDPVKLLVKQEQLTLEGIRQHFVAVDSDEVKSMALKDLFKVLSMSQCIVYCNSVHRCDGLYQSLLDDNFPVLKINGSMSSQERNEACTALRNGDARVLITTDLFARGIDIQQVSYVLNYDIPRDVSTYLHRIGRSGRWGRKGVAINFMSKQEQYRLQNIEKYYQTEITELPLEFAVA